MLEDGTLLHNIYRIKKLLGKGAMGSVYLVERLDDKRELVVKKLNFSDESRVNKDSAKEIFFREAEFMARFEHSGLPRMHGIFSHDGHDYIAMDYVKGSTLEDIINKKTIPLEKAIKWAIEIADILNYLHNTFEMPLIYKDLKPSNIMITPNEKVMIIDFGICRYYNPDKDTDTFRLGSPGYAAPEQYKGRGQSCIQTDIYALGVILFQMVTKYDPTLTPFKFPPVKSLNPSIDDRLEAIISRAIELKPLNRYIGALEFKEKLEQYRSERFLRKSKEIKKQLPPKTPVIKSQKKISHIKSGPVPVKKKNFTLIEFMILLAILSILAAIIMPHILGSSSIGKRNDCVKNIKKIADALKACSSSRGGVYPPGISSAIRLGYIKELKCPVSDQDYIYITSSDRKAYTLYCPGDSVHENSEIKKFKGHYPQYSSSEGLIPDIWE